jgi:phosphate starvation-inducible protein PhoH
MSKTRSSQTKTKKVTISQLNNHVIHNKRQAMKDLKQLNFDEMQFKNPAQKRFYNTVSKKDVTFCIGPAGVGKTYLSKRNTRTNQNVCNKNRRK